MSEIGKGNTLTLTELIEEITDRFCRRSAWKEAVTYRRRETSVCTYMDILHVGSNIPLMDPKSDRDVLIIYEIMNSI